jgi:hypothetical protein
MMRSIDSWPRPSGVSYRREQPQSIIAQLPLRSTHVRAGRRRVVAFGDVKLFEDLAGGSRFMQLCERCWERFGVDGVEQAEEAVYFERAWLAQCYQRLDAMTAATPSP